MEAEFFMFKPGDEEPSTDHARRRLVLRPCAGGSRRRRAARDRRCRSSAWGSRSKPRTTRSRHGQHEIDFRYAEVLKTADNITHVQVRRENVARTFGSHRLVHAEADLRPERKRDAYAPVVSSAARKTRSGTRARTWELSSTSASVLHWRSAASRSGVLRDHESARQLLQAPRARATKRRSTSPGRSGTGRR